MKEAVQKFKSLRFVKALGFNRVFLIFIIFFMCLLFTILTPILSNGASFVNYNRIMSALNYAYFIGFLGLGVTFVIATGGIDFSIGAVIDTAAPCQWGAAVPLPQHMHGTMQNLAAPIAVSRWNPQKAVWQG